MLLNDDPSLVAEPATLMWREWPTFRVDMCVFQRERQLALQALAAGDHDAMLEHAAAAVEEYRGDLLAGMFDDWVLLEREQLRGECVELCDHLVAAGAASATCGKPWSTAGSECGWSPSRKPDTGRSWRCRLTRATGRAPSARSISAPRSWTMSCRSSLPKLRSRPPHRNDLRARAQGVLIGLAPMPFSVLQTTFDALLPTGLQWYRKVDLFEEITDEAIAIHRRVRRDHSDGPVNDAYVSD